jgi:hypothetical protein
MTRAALIDAVRDALGDRQVLWFGTRGLDAQPFVSLEQLTAVYSLTCPLDIEGIDEACLEQRTGVRVDLDLYDIDLDPSPALREMRRELLGLLNQPSVVIGYRPSRYLSAIQFACHTTAASAVMFNDHQAMFEHKPWVESDLRDLDVPIIPWQYIADEQHAEVFLRVHEGPVMLRPSRGSGGVGMQRVSTETDLDAHWPSQVEAFVSVAPYLDDVIPLNVAGCIDRHGALALHAPSVQLIGLPQCTTRPFGYCGNDYGSASSLEPAVVEQIDRSMTIIGRWLASHRYVGAFGVDFLVHEGTALFSEINARFQGCSLLGGTVDMEMGLPDVHMEHLAAHLGLSLPPRPPLSEQAATCPQLSHLVIHNVEPVPVIRTEPTAPDEWPQGLREITSTAGREITVFRGGVIARVVLDGPGFVEPFSLSDRTDRLVAELARTYSKADT